MRLRGKGVSHLRGRGRGDEYVRIAVAVPEKLTREQKRIVEERVDFVSYSNSLLISRLLNVLDNLENLEKHNGDMGFKLTLKEFRQILNEEGLLEIDTLGKDFDSNTMEAIETVEGEERKAVEVVLKGYMLKNKLLRPAKVKVGQKQKEEN